jgi:hypothetical protein
VDRSSVRSFRAVDQAERTIRDLVRSRLDTTREATFQTIGPRFFDAREDAVRIAALLREDAYRAPNGYFSRLALRPDPALADRLARLDPLAVEARIVQATREALARELPRAQGVYLVRHEPSSRGGLEPVAHVQLSSRLANGGPAPALSRDQAERFQHRWAHEVSRAFGLQRGRLGLDRGVERAPALAPETDRLRQEWARASARLFAVYADRFSGKASANDLTAAVGKARAGREAWRQRMGPAVDLREVDTRRVMDVVRIRIEGGSRYLSGPLEPHRRAVVERAAARVAGLPEETERRLSAVTWPAGRDLHVALYFNQRGTPERSAGQIEPEGLRDAIEQHFRPELVRLAPTIDHAAAGRESELGTAYARVVKREAPVAVPPRTREEPGGPIAVVLTRAAELSRAESGPHLPSPESGPGRLQDHASAAASERVFAVSLRVPTGAEEIGLRDLSAEDAARVVQRAVDRAYPFLRAEGLRDTFSFSAHDRALDVRILVPERLGWTPEQLRSPQFQQRLIAGFHKAASEVGVVRTVSDRQPGLTTAARSVAIARQAPQLLRQMEQEPEQAAKSALRAVFSKLSEALPKPFRMLRDVGRTLTRFSRTGE